ncbi:MAG: hypothetical protein HUU55_06850 [Myxococcales bacterium]|nr:hypothetical protein [Myxococcales bacterium]
MGALSVGMADTSLGSVQDPRRQLARISHHPPATTAKLHVFSGCAPSAVLSGLKARLRASTVRAPRIHRHFGALAAKSGEKSGLGRRWPLRTLLVSLVTGLCCGATSLREVEYLTTHLANGARRVLKIFRRVPDTTLRDLLVHLEPEPQHLWLQVQVRRLIRRKSLHPIGTLPFGVLALDGKSVTVKNWDGV